MMGVSARMDQMEVQQLMSLLCLLCLVLVLLMLVALVLLYRRTRRTQEDMRGMNETIMMQLAEADSRANEASQQTQRLHSEAMQTMNESVVRMMGEVTRTQQGQMDALSGQMRAAGKQEEERMERMRQTMDRRLSSYEERLSGVTQTLEEKLSGHEARMERMRETLEGGLTHMREDNDRELERMRQTVDEKLNATIDQRLEASFAQVTRRLEQVTSSLSAMQSLAGSVDELRYTLGGAQPLGVWGEVQLGTLLAQMLAPDQYAQHAAVRPGAEACADYVVVMPGQGHGHTVYLPIDAGLPMREYTELRVAMEHGSHEEIENARGLLESAVRMHARRMSEKLIAPPYTTDYAVLFLPNEGLYAEVLRIGGLAERIQNESRMVIAGPTTFAALLQSLQMGFRSLAIEQRTEEIMALLGAVRADFGGFAGLLNRTQKRLRQASETIETAQRHSETIVRRLSDMGELPGGQTAALPHAADADALLALEDDEEDSWD